MEKYIKITTGFVSQIFEKRNDMFVCTQQEFISGDSVEYEDEEGNPVDIDITKESYQYMDMRCPEGGDWIEDRWNIEDVSQQALTRDIELSDQQSLEILHRIDEDRDASIGINWDVIDAHIDMYLDEISKK